VPDITNIVKPGIAVTLLYVSCARASCHMYAMTF
jgi:hypothetical protein